MKNCIGIRIENKDFTERRAPLTPEQVQELTRREGLRVLVEPSDTRVFSDVDYRQAGAEITTDLSASNIILGVKEIPLADFAENQAYCFFSHTIKGQEHNMPMLQRMLALGDTLLDYELVANAEGRRLIFFGNFAGFAGMIDTLWALGKRLRWEGLETPFQALQPTHRYPSLADAKAAVQAVGEAIRREGLPKALTPLVSGFSGYGQVSKGAQEIYDLLPVETVAPEDLKGFFEKGQFSNRAVYKAEFHEKHMFRLKTGEGEPASFELQDYFDHPERYRGIFQQYLPFLTALVNGIYWTPECPRLVTRAYLKELFRQEKQPRLRVIGDISCDIEGSIEMTVKATNSKNPIYVYDPLSEAVSDGHEGRGTVIMAVDKLPAELPREASKFFGESLLPFVPALAAVDFSQPFAKLALPEEFRGAVIAHQGKLTPEFEYLREYVSG